MTENKLTVFNSEVFGQVRVVEINGEPWFVATDVCRALGLEQVSRAMDRLDDDERGLLKVTHPQSPEKAMEVNGVNEPGLYHLVLCSNKGEAKDFKRWITHEVIPSIRKHGAYMTEVTIDNIIANPDFGIKLLMDLKEERERRKRLEEEQKAAKPKVEYFDDLVDRNLLTNFRDTAKELGIREREFIRFLEEYDYIYRDSKKRIKPLAEHVQNGIFEIKDAKSANSTWAGNQTLITPKGKSTFQLLLPMWLKRRIKEDFIC